MAFRPTTVERAFEIARSGALSSLIQLMRQLAQEGYADVRAQLDGAAIRKQIQDILVGVPSERSKAPS